MTKFLEGVAFLVEFKSVSGRYVRYGVLYAFAIMNFLLILSNGVNATVSLTFDTGIPCSVLRYCRVVDAYDSHGSSKKLVIFSIRKVNWLPGLVKPEVSNTLLPFRNEIFNICSCSYQSGGILFSLVLKFWVDVDEFN